MRERRLEMIAAAFLATSAIVIDSAQRGITNEPKAFMRSISSRIRFTSFICWEDSWPFAALVNPAWGQ